jgi:transposase
MGRREDPSDISDEEGAILEPLIPPAKPGGRVRTTNMRAVINALFSEASELRPRQRKLTQSGESTSNLSKEGGK